MDYVIKEYLPEYEEQWLTCLKEAFYTSSYVDTIIKLKPRYENPLLELMMLKGNKVVAFLDIDVVPPSEQLCGENVENSAQISIIGVHPKYRRQKLATRLFEYAFSYIEKNTSISRLEISFREDEGMLNWLQALKFSRCAKYYEVSFSQDFFIKYRIDLPFGISPSILTGFVDQSGFRLLSVDHPPEKTYPFIVMEKIL